ncbi:putative polysaccharide deacetylase domain protein [Burkholderia pseudomallei MSHR684]|nr:putative polysaccharide deacetylase domain protein [Burkholderia pseudomallei MSHR684]
MPRAQRKTRNRSGFRFDFIAPFRFARIEWKTAGGKRSTRAKHALDRRRARAQCIARTERNRPPRKIERATAHVRTRGTFAARPRSGRRRPRERRGTAPPRAARIGDMQHTNARRLDVHQRSCVRRRTAAAPSAYSGALHWCGCVDLAQRTRACAAHASAYMLRMLLTRLASPFVRRRPTGTPMCRQHRDARAGNDARGPPPIAACVQPAQRRPRQLSDAHHHVISFPVHLAHGRFRPRLSARLADRRYHCVERRARRRRAADRRRRARLSPFLERLRRRSDDGRRRDIRSATRAPAPARLPVRPAARRDRLAARRARRAAVEGDRADDRRRARIDLRLGPHGRAARAGADHAVRLSVRDR